MYMKFILKVAVVVVIAILLISSTYVIFFTGKENNRIKDTDAPTINDITGETTGTTGKITTITVTFSDNINVTNATLYYKSESAYSWSNTSILSGNADIVIPSDSDEDWYYYVTVDDAAGNGPVGDPSTDGSSYYTITVSKNVEDLVHYVFIEEGAVSWCDNCPAVAEILYELYHSDKYNFYYVSMVADKNDKAKDHLEKDYNIAGYPTVFIDGGYDVIYGGDNPKSVFEEKISKAMKRDVPDLYINVTTEVAESGEDIKTTILIENYEDELYTGRLKVYLSKRIAWQNFDGEPFHFGFLDYIVNEDVSILDNDQIVIEKTYDVSDKDIDNLMVIAVVFSSESHQQYSDPPTNEHPFDAYYADAADGTLVVEGGNLPPEVGITNPKNGRINFFGITGPATLKLKTYLVGRATIAATASDDSKVEKVEFYIDDKLVAEFTEEPYEWKSKFLLRTPFIPRDYTITVMAYDDEGKVSTTSLDVIAFRAFRF